MREKFFSMKQNNFCASLINYIKQKLSVLIMKIHLSVYLMNLLLKLLDPCVKALFFFTFLHKMNKIFKLSTKIIGILLGKAGKVTGISEEISVERLLHVLFFLSAHAEAYMS